MDHEAAKTLKEIKLGEISSEDIIYLLCDHYDFNELAYICIDVAYHAGQENGDTDLDLKSKVKMITRQAIKRRRKKDLEKISDKVKTLLLNIQFS
jgi:hypothetical protein